VDGVTGSLALYLDVEFLAALAAAERFLALRMLAPVMASKLVQAHKCLLALGAARWDLLVVAGLERRGRHHPLRASCRRRRGTAPPP